MTVSHEDVEAIQEALTLAAEALEKIDIRITAQDSELTRLASLMERLADLAVRAADTAVKEALQLREQGLVLQEQDVKLRNLAAQNLELVQWFQDHGSRIRSLEMDRHVTDQV